MGEKIISGGGGVHGCWQYPSRGRTEKGIFFILLAQKSTAGAGQKVIFTIENNNKFHGWKARAGKTMKAKPSNASKALSLANDF